jgi:deoxycytidylate deaminase
MRAIANRVIFIIIAALSRMDAQKVTGKYVAIGKNNLIPQYNTPTLHAEIDAYIKLPRYYYGIDLDMVVVRFAKDGRLCQSRPCYHCLRTLASSKITIKNVYYSNNGKMCKEKFCDMIDSPLTTISSGMRHKNSACPIF